ncbi:hypothetical protein V1478_006326 [Vespula squamosa]|uniref:Uncharacterized protein n=1 Tax=Vespula squamosa TaxID=30214 RepID=A0ABD2B7I2_VESSQ
MLNGAILSRIPIEHPHHHRQQLARILRVGAFTRDLRDATNNSINVDRYVQPFVNLAPVTYSSRT